MYGYRGTCSMGIFGLDVPAADGMYTLIDDLCKDVFNIADVDEAAVSLTLCLFLGLCMWPTT